MVERGRVVRTGRHRQAQGAAGGAQLVVAPGPRAVAWPRNSCAREGLAIAFDMGVHRVEAGCFAENTAPGRSWRRSGMRREIHTVRDCMHRDGGDDGYGYAMLAEEYRGR
ncbi:GNAT family protein [Kocuria rhizophila]|nr:GNAT family protein [Kocuria rhizophila]